jgi:hypothetical protein
MRVFRGQLLLCAGLVMLGVAPTASVAQVAPARTATPPAAAPATEAWEFEGLAITPPKSGCVNAPHSMAMSRWVAVGPEIEAKRRAYVADAEAEGGYAELTYVTVRPDRPMNVVLLQMSIDCPLSAGGTERVQWLKFYYDSDSLAIERRMKSDSMLFEAKEATIINWLKLEVRDYLERSAEGMPKKMTVYTTWGVRG